MRAPAAAALLLAALTALPCRGIDADESSTVLNNSTRHLNTPQPTVNKLYQMLHTNLQNGSQFFNLNYSNNFHSFYESLESGVNKNRGVRNILHAENISDSLNVSIRQNSLNSQKTPADLIDCCLKGEVSIGKDDTRNRYRRVVNLHHNNEHLETSAAPVTNPPLIMERRKKGDTGSSAPLLNYIFDTYSNTHQHRNEKAGRGSGIYAAAAPEIEALVGSTAHLDCKVDALHDKLVSWVRRKNQDDPMELLYTGTQQYTADDRYSSLFIPPDIWRLEVKEVRPSDAALYDCQMPTHPPRTARVTLRVPEVSVRIVDGAGAAVSEQVCELGSTVALRCEVRGMKMEGGPSLLWYRKDDLLNDDTTRGGISVRTEFGQNGANSVLRVARVRGDDAGRYTCMVARAPPPTPPPAYVILHVIKGESLAELHQGGSTPSISTLSGVALALSVLLHNMEYIIM